MFIYNLKAIAKKMKIDFDEVTSKINHNGEKGTTREELLKSYMERLLPQKYKVGRGVIVDSDEQQSNQQDFIIYDAFSSPLMLAMETVQIIPIESIYCTIEIKSSLNKTTLQQCVENIKSVRALKKNTLNNVESTTLGFVFAYTSDTSIEAIMGNLFEFNKTIEPNLQISVICILDKGLIINVSKANLSQIELIPTASTSLAISTNKLENNLCLFYLIILQYLNSARVATPDLMIYAKKQGILDVKFSIPKDYVPEDGFFVYDGRKICMKDMQDIIDSMLKFKIFQDGNASQTQLIEFICIDIIKSIELTTGNLDNNMPFNFCGKLYDIALIKKFSFLYRKKSEQYSLSDKEETFYKDLANDLYEQYKAKDTDYLFAL